MSNFQSFSGEHDITFQDGLTVIYGENKDNPGKTDSNGSGKTSILAAISWAMYGQTPSGSSKDEVITHGEMGVQVTLELSQIVVVRSKTRGRSEVLKFKVDGRDWVHGDLGWTQQRLEEHFGIDYSVFGNTVLLGKASKCVDFLRARPADRAKVLSSLVDDEPYQRAAGLVSNDINMGDLDVQEKTSKLSYLSVSRKRVCDRLEQQKKQLEEASLLHLKKKNETVLEMNEIRAEIEKAKRAFSVDTPTTLEALTREKVLYQKKLDQIVRSSGAKSSLVARIGDLASRSPVGSECPTCLRALDEDCWILLEETKERTVEELENLVRAESLVRKKIGNLESELNSALAIERNKREAEEKIKQLTREWRLMKDSLQDLSITHLQSNIKQTREELAEFDKAIEEANSQILHGKEELRKLKIMQRMFRQDLRNILFDRVRNSLSYYTKLYTYQLLGEQVKISFPPVTKTGAEKFDVTLSTKGHEQDLSSYSEGESWRATFGVLLALRRTLLDGNQGSFDFLMVDDPLGALDDSGSREFIRLLGRLAKDKTQILVTLPRRPDMGDAEYTKLCVIKERGSSKLFRY